MVCGHVSPYNLPVVEGLYTLVKSDKRCMQTHSGSSCLQENSWPRQGLWDTESLKPINPNAARNPNTRTPKTLFTTCSGMEKVTPWPSEQRTKEAGELFKDMLFSQVLEGSRV